MAIGIDLGTSNSCVAIARGGRVEVLPNRYGEPISASVVCFQANGATLVGNEAKARAVHEPNRTITASKRLIGRYYFSEEVKKAKAVCSYEIVEGANHSARVRVGDEVMAVPELSALVLREMKEIAEARLGERVSEAVITVPAYFNDNQRQATRDAGRIAGLEVLRLLNEPTAAALAYGFGRGLTQRVAVYDLGGGTFDISILEIGTDVFEVLSTCGDTFLGGEDFDDRLIDLLADEFHSKHHVNLRNDPNALETLKAAAEEAKKGLSIDDHIEIYIPHVANDAEGNPLHVERRIDRAEYGSLIADLIQRTFKVCDEALQQASLTIRDLDGVILVGGPTRLPLIHAAVAQYFQQEPKTDVDPDQVVAMGAAIHAASLVGDEDDSYLLDVTPLSLRIGVAGGLAETVIERNTPVPIEQTRSFTTFRDYQQSVKIRVYQGEARTAEENELLGEFEFSGFKNARRGEVRIEVTFEIDTDGIVNVTARDPDTDEQASTRIHLSSGLSEDELQTILEKQGPEAARPRGDGGATARAEPHFAASDEIVAADEIDLDASLEAATPLGEPDIDLDAGDPVVDAAPTPNPALAAPAGEREIELEALGEDPQDLELEAEVADDEISLETLRESADSPPLEEAEIDSIELLESEAVTRSGELLQGPGNDLFDAPGTDLSHYQDEEPQGSS